MSATGWQAFPLKDNYPLTPLEGPFLLHLAKQPVSVTARCNTGLDYGTGTSMG